MKCYSLSEAFSNIDQKRLKMVNIAMMSRAHTHTHNVSIPMLWDESQSNEKIHANLWLNIVNGIDNNKMTNRNDMEV